MTRVASLYLPQLPIERLRRMERPAAPPERRSSSIPLSAPIDDDPGACSVPRGGGWRPGARWAQEGALGAQEGALGAQRGGSGAQPNHGDIDSLPAHQRPTPREMGRRSEAADHPFKALRADDGAGAVGAEPMPWHDPWARPRVLIARSGQRERITAACAVALSLGLRPGMAAAQARAQIADLEVGEADPEGDQAFLERLALHAVAHWTPTASPSGDDGLWLDLTGTTHLFGGEASFCRRLLRYMARLGYTAAIAVADTPGAAHGLARYGGNAITLIPPGGQTQAMAELPLAALRLAPEALAAAARFGLAQVADLYPMPRGPLARRFGRETVNRLDQARGLTAEPIIPVLPFEAPASLRRLLEPIGTASAIAHVIGDLIDDLVDQLRRRGLGLRTALLTCERLDQSDQRLGLGTARATRDARHLKRMFKMRIERIEPGFGIEAMSLVASRVEPLAPQAIGVGLSDEPHVPDLAPLVDQLGGRVGEEALFRVSAIESDVPERAVHRMPPLARPTGWPDWTRPARMLPRPEPLGQVMALLPDHPPRRFIWRGRTYRIVAGDGPERIHGEWWRNDRELWAVRDYFRVETDGGARFWLFRRGDGVDEATGDLSWFMHGLFG